MISTIDSFFIHWRQPKPNQSILRKDYHFVTNKMAYWWVNHKQTFTSEIMGGYIWSPTTNSNGRENQTYTNLTFTGVGDTIFSYAGGLIRAVGIISSPSREQPKPIEFKNAGENWASFGWAVSVDWTILPNAIAPRDHINQIAPLLPSKHSPIKADGKGNQGCYLALISNELGYLLLNIAGIAPGNRDALQSFEIERTELEDVAISEQIDHQAIEPTEREQIIRARIGQGKFRNNVEEIENSCRVTGVKVKHLLIASHIKPWRDSDNRERLDGNNGLLLSPHIDKLFDQGWITFRENSELLCANDEVQNVLEKWGVMLPITVGDFNEKQGEYLYSHRRNVFRG